jgi:hypothetical protein
METETAALMATDINRRKWRKALMQPDANRREQIRNIDEHCKNILFKSNFSVYLNAYYISITSV